MRLRLAAAIALAAGTALLAAGPAIHLVLLVDVSTSMVGVGNPKVSEAAADLEGELQPDDRVWLASFADQLHVTTRAIQGRQLREAAGVLGDDFGWPSRLWDALGQTAERLGSTGRRAIIVITDGRGSGNLLGADEVIERLRAAEVRVFALAPAVRGTPPQPDPYARLMQLSAATGGHFYPFESGRVRTALALAVADARR